MKAADVTGVILAAGEGRRMGELSIHFAKPVLPLCNKPLIAYDLQMLAGLGVQKVVVVVGYRDEQVRQAVERYRPDGIKVIYVEQRERLGIAHALLQAREHIGPAMIVILGDTHFIPRKLEAGLEKLAGGDNGPVAAVLSVRRVKDPEMIRKECSVRFDFTGRLVQIVEKPREPFNDMKPCGVYFFRDTIFEAIEMTHPSALRGEVEITDSIQTLVDLGHDVAWAPTIAWDRNITYPGDLLISNLVELRRLDRKVLLGEDVRLHEETSLRECVVGDNVDIRSPARIERSLVLHDVVIEDHGHFRDCIIGERFVIADCLRHEWADTPIEI